MIRRFIKVRRLLKIREFIRDHRGDFVETALIWPILLLMIVGFINLLLFGVTGLNANNAAMFGARAGSVAQTDQITEAVAASNQALGIIAPGSYDVNAVCDPDCEPGSTISVVVTYRVRNYFQGLMAFFGVTVGPMLEGRATSSFRLEGW